MKSLVHETDEAIIDELKEHGVVKVRNIPLKNSKGAARGPVFVLYFQKDEIPSQLRIAYEVVKVRPYVPEPLRCFRCNKLNHMAKDCRLPAEVKVCLNCGEIHELIKGIRCQREPKCVNCNGPHSSASKECTKFLMERDLLKLSVDKKMKVSEVKMAVKSGSISLPVPKPGISWASVVSHGLKQTKEVEIQTELSIFDPTSPFFLGIKEMKSAETNTNDTISDEEMEDEDEEIEDEDKQTELLHKDFKRVNELKGKVSDEQYLREVEKLKHKVYKYQEGSEYRKKLRSYKTKMQSDNRQMKPGEMKKGG